MRIILGGSPSLRHLCLATRRESVLRGDGRRAEYHHTSSCQNLDSRPRGSFELLRQASFFPIREPPRCSEPGLWLGATAADFDTI